MTRKQILEQIRAEYAQNGKCTDIAMRLYAENRIGYAAFTNAAKRGLEIYAANAPCAEQFDGVVDRALKPAMPFEDLAKELGI